MKTMKIALFAMLFLLAAWAWCAEIHDAALAGDLAKVKSILNQDPAQLNAKGRNDKAPIHWAAQGGHLAVVKYLLAKGAPVNALNVQKENALVYAAEQGHLKLAAFLIANGAAVNIKTTLDASPINYALWAGRTEVVKLLLRKGADFRASRGDGSTLLHEAAGGESVEIVEMLLKRGLAADLKTGFGATPLHYASLHGTPEIVALLIRKGVDVNAVSENGWWPLGLAAGRGDLRKASLLLEAGARPDIRDKASGLTVLHVAAAKGYGKICEQLLAHGADVNAKAPQDRTPLYYASRYGHAGLSAALKERGGILPPGESLPGVNWLSKPLEPGQAVVWYLGHSGWAVKTRNHLLLFDYWKQGATPDEPALANGTINPGELASLNVTVFASHDHGDHFMPDIFAWRKSIPAIRYVTGFKPEGQEGCEQLPDREKRELGGLEIIPIKSNDSGQGYFVKADGVSIFHPGDHANRKRDFSGPFKTEIDFLADMGLKADILFAPVSGCGFGDLVAVTKGVYYAIDRLSARSVFPMHAGGNESRYRDFAKNAAGAGYDVPVCPAEFAGDHFVVTPKEVKGAYCPKAACSGTDTGSCGN